MSTETADFIANGREYIEKNGWWRNQLLGPNKRQACLIGGLLFGNGLGTKDWKDPRYMSAYTAVGAVLPPIYLEDIEYWNDRVATDKQEVLDVLAKAEKIERGFDPDKGLTLDEL